VLLRRFFVEKTELFVGKQLTFKGRFDKINVYIFLFILKGQKP